MLSNRCPDDSANRGMLPGCVALQVIDLLITRPCKIEYRSLFLALQADAKSYPGGISALADTLGINRTSLCNCLNPDHESQPPSFAVILEIINLCDAKRAIFALAQLTDQIPMDICLSNASESSQINLFLSLVGSIAPILNNGSEAAKDGRFDAKEKKDLAPMLLSLIQVASQLYKSFNE